jgi:hypothetical protein
VKKRKQDQITKFFQINEIMKKAGNGVAGTSAFPNGVWERGEALLQTGHDFVATHKTYTHDNDEAKQQEPKGAVCFRFQRIDLMRDVCGISQQDQQDYHRNCIWFSGTTTVGEIDETGKSDGKDEYSHDGYEQCERYKITVVQEEVMQEDRQARKQNSGEIDTKPPGQTHTTRRCGSFFSRFSGLVSISCVALSVLAVMRGKGDSERQLTVAEPATVT